MTVYNRTITDKILEQLPEMTKELRKMIGKKEEECKRGNKQRKEMEEMDM